MPDYCKVEAFQPQAVSTEPETEVVSKPETQNVKPETSNSSNLSNPQASFVSPRAKNLAEKEALKASELAGSGPKGRVIEKDVKAALENRPKMTSLAKKIASEEGVQP
jgi:pyruvate dehydrogenase E2 component (dihydrolipoamide acetyltransferase)